MPTKSVYFSDESLKQISDIKMLAKKLKQILSLSGIVRNAVDYWHETQMALEANKDV